MGYQVAVQAVNRKGHPYYRLAPYTILYPTPRQRMVRNTLATASHNSVDMKYYEINQNVKDAFSNWERTEKGQSRLYQTLTALYGETAKDVLEYVSKQKIVSNLIRAPEINEQFQSQARRIEKTILTQR
jgi:hypothetical protein